MTIRKGARGFPQTFQGVRMVYISRCLLSFSIRGKDQKYNPTSNNLNIKSIFSLEGFPLAIVSDNGRQFSSSEFEDFDTSNSIKHLFSPMYHPQSKWLAERFVQTIKTSISKSVDEGSNLEDALIDFLFL
ncbi:Pol polyprotein [Thelohanellus kitauei]|uniref:Pol polyprotein n=1 Tax=Thelohanellus kitauei TaxID=669202 RepID=A0A0C2MF77_THEKT|nr:Pol polyprotein [Thelohanellus kitauei]